MHCEHNIPETKKGLGPCDIRWEVRKRNGLPNWWCRTHGLEACAPDGAPMDRCSGAWFLPVSEDMQIDIDLADGEVAVWGVTPPAISIGKVPSEPGQGSCPLPARGNWSQGTRSLVRHRENPQC